MEPHNKDTFLNEEVGIFDYLLLIKRRKKTFLVSFLVFLITGITYSLFIPKSYKSEAVIMPKGESNSGGGLGSLLGAGLLGGMGKGVVSTGSAASNKIKIYLNSYSLFITIIKKDEVRARLIEFIDAGSGFTKQLSPTELDELLARRLRGMVKAEVEDSGVILVSILTRDPHIAQFLLKHVLSGLNEYLISRSMDDADSDLNLIGKQLIKNRKEVIEYSSWLTNYYEHNREIASKSVLDVPIGLNTEASIVTGTPDENVPVGSGVVIKDIPVQVYLKYLQQQSDILSNINKMLSEQYYMAIVNHIKDTVNFRIIDAPDLQLSPVKPVLKMLFIVITVGALFIGLIMVFVTEFLDGFKKKLEGIDK